MAQTRPRPFASCVRKFSRAAPLLIALAGFATSKIASGTDGTWISGFSGSWDNPASWQSGNVADGAGSTANFNFDVAGGGAGITSDVNVQLDISSHTIGFLNIGDLDGSNHYTISSLNPALYKLTFDSGDVTDAVHAQLNQVVGSAGDTISAPIILNNSLDITNASLATLTISGTIQSSGLSATLSVLSGPVIISGVISNGGGTVAVRTAGSTTVLTLSAANTYTGGTFIDGGTINFSNATALGGFTGGTVTLGSSGGGNASLFSTANSLTLPNNIVVASGTGGTSTLGTTGTSGTYSGTILLNGDLTVTDPTALILSGITSGVGSLTKTGAGTLTLNASNTYSGGTILNAGTLILNGSSTIGGGVITSSPIGTGTLTLTGGTLRSDSGTARTIENNVILNGIITLGGTFTGGGNQNNGFSPLIPQD